MPPLPLGRYYFNGNFATRKMVNGSRYQSALYFFPFYQFPNLLFVRFLTLESFYQPLVKFSKFSKKFHSLPNIYPRLILIPFIILGNF